MRYELQRGKPSTEAYSKFSRSSCGKTGNIFGVGVNMNLTLSGLAIDPVSIINDYPVSAMGLKAEQNRCESLRECFQEVGKKGSRFL